MPHPPSTVFDSSVERGTPFSFKLGAGQVIKVRQHAPPRHASTPPQGWDQGLINMCIGEKRKIKIPSDMGYGEHGSPPKIPGGATLIFGRPARPVHPPNTSSSTETELIDIEEGSGVPPPLEVHPSGDDYY